MQASPVFACAYVHVCITMVADVGLWVLQLAYQRGYITAEERSRVFGVMRSLGLALWHEVCTLDVLMQVRFKVQVS